jgi:hypothetical protein
MARQLSRATIPKHHGTQNDVSLSGNTNQDALNARQPVLLMNTHQPAAPNAPRNLQAPNWHALPPKFDWLPVNALNPSFMQPLSATFAAAVVVSLLLSLTQLIALFAPMLNLNIMQRKCGLERRLPPKVTKPIIDGVAVEVVRARNLKTPHRPVKQPNWLLVLTDLDDLRITAVANHDFSSVQVGLF